MLLIASIFILFLCAFVYHSISLNEKVSSFIDGFIFVSVSGLVLLHVLPELMHGEILIPICLIIIGFIGPSFLEKLLHSQSKSIHRATTVSYTHLTLPTILLV